MKRKLLLTISLITISLICGNQSFAGGLYLSQVTSPVSLGTAGVSNVVNNIAADAAYTNPAGMTGIERDTLMPGIQVLFPVVKFKSSAGPSGDDGGNAGTIAAIPGLSAVKVLSDKFRLGLAVTAPLGGGVDYGDNFVGRYSATRAFLSGLGITPSLAYKINNKVSVGAGITAIYTVMDMDVSINRKTVLNPNAPDGKVFIDKADDWSYQGLFGLTWQVTDKAMLGFTYRTKSEVELEGDLAFQGTPLLNLITGSPDTVGVDFEYAQVFAVGLAYQASDNLKLIVDFDYEDWSEFSNNYISVDTAVTSINTTVDRNWKDTWHIGMAAIYKFDDGRFSTAGIGYDSSAVDDEDRTADLPVDEQLKLGFSYGKLRGEGKIDYAVGLGFGWLGNGKIDQVAQGVRYTGEFDSNYFISLGGNIRYHF
jgi:long-chain fatty acid transport protein